MGISNIKQISEETYQELLERIRVDLNLEKTIEERFKSYNKKVFYTINDTTYSGVDENIFYINVYNISRIEREDDFGGVINLIITFKDDSVMVKEYDDEDEFEKDYKMLNNYLSIIGSTRNIDELYSDPFDEDSDSDQNEDSDSENTTDSDDNGSSDSDNTNSQIELSIATLSQYVGNNYCFRVGNTTTRLYASIEEITNIERKKVTIRIKYFNTYDDEEEIKDGYLYVLLLDSGTYTCFKETENTATLLNPIFNTFRPAISSETIDTKTWSMFLAIAKTECKKIIDKKTGDGLITSVNSNYVSGKSFDFVTLEGNTFKFGKLTTDKVKTIFVKNSTVGICFTHSNEPSILKLQGELILSFESGISDKIVYGCVSDSDSESIGEEIEILSNVFQYDIIKSGLKNRITLIINQYKNVEFKFLYYRYETVYDDEGYVQYVDEEQTIPKTELIEHETYLKFNSVYELDYTYFILKSSNGYLYKTYYKGDKLYRCNSNGNIINSIEEEYSPSPTNNFKELKDKIKNASIISND